MYAQDRMAEAARGHREGMDEEHEQEHPTVNQPLHGQPRPRLGPALAVIAMVVGIVVLFVVITLLRYHAS